MTSVVTFLEGLVAASEKAAQISKIIRLAYLAADGANSIATEEKSTAGWQRQMSKDTDFKTLADVLIQSVIDSDLRKLFPEIKNIRGEENGNFQSADTSNLCIQIDDKLETTAQMLAQALPDNAETVSKLSSLIHSTVSVPAAICTELSQCKGSIDLSDVSIWIDPIDATKEYVRAKEPVFDGEIHFKGLSCTTVLIGVYSNSSGHAVAGVVSRPFTSTDDCSSEDMSSRWKNEIYWGYTSPAYSIASSNCVHSSSKWDMLRIATSSGERMPFLVNNTDYEIISPKGAGNKIMTVVNGFVDLYVITLESNVVHRWDTCAGHAILSSSGGSILSYEHTLNALTAYKGALEDFPFSDYSIDYRGGEEPLSNGIVAYRELRHVIRLFSDLLIHLNIRT